MEYTLEYSILPVVVISNACASKSPPNCGVVSSTTFEMPPPADVLSVAGSHVVPLYFRTCPVVGVTLLTSVNCPSEVAPPPPPPPPDIPDKSTLLPLDILKILPLIERV